MPIKLIADNFKELVLSGLIPPALKNHVIAGAQAVTGSGTFGHVLVQEIRSKETCIQLQHYQLTRSTTITLAEEQPLLALRFLLDNHIQYHLPHLGNIIFYEQGYNLLYLPVPNNRLHFPAAGEYIAIDIRYSQHALLKMKRTFAIVGHFAQKVKRQQPALLTPVNQVASRKLMAMIEHLLHTPNSGNRRASTLYTRSMELFAACLESISQQQVLEPVSLSMTDAHGIYHARRLMQQKLKLDWTLRELSEQTGLNGYKLKTGFQQLYQSSPSDYLRDLRMEKAWLLLPGKRYSVSQVADLVGYTNLSSFSKAFKKYFSITPKQRSLEAI